MRGCGVDSNDFWTHIGLVVAAFAFVVAPRLFAPGHTVNSMIYLGGAVVVVVVAVAARRRTIRHGEEQR